MSSPRFPDDPNTPQPPATSPSRSPDDAGAAPAMPPGYPPAPGVYPAGAYPPGYPPQGTYPPAPGSYPPSAPPYYGPPSTPLEPGAYPPPPGIYPAPPSTPLDPRYSAPPSMPFPPGYGTPAPNSQFGLSAALSMPMIEPSPNIRQGFLIAGIGGGVAFLAYFVFGLPWFWPMWLVPVLAALVGVLGFIPGARNRLYGPLTPRNGAITTIVASALGLLFLLFVWGGFGNFGSWIVTLGLLAGIVGGVRVYREAPPASVVAPPSSPLPSSYAAAPPSSPLPPMPSPTIQTATDSAQPAPKQKPGGSGEGKNLIVAGLVLVLDLISSAWDLILKIAFVIFVVALAVGFIKSCAGGGLNEHSSCQQFQQADSSAQNKVLQDMMTAHHDQSSVSTARFSVTLYCNIYGGSAPIDGVYSSGDLGQQPAQALHISQRH